jgi:hypothetical protein
MRDLETFKRISKRGNGINSGKGNYLLKHGTHLEFA